MDSEFKEKHFRATKAILGELLYQKNENILEPYYLARIITENGQMWQIPVSAFLFDEAKVLDAWDKQPSLFSKIQTN